MAEHEAVEAERLADEARAAEEHGQRLDERASAAVTVRFGDVHKDEPVYISAGPDPSTDRYVTVGPVVLLYRDHNEVRLIHDTCPRCGAERVPSAQSIGSLADLGWAIRQPAYSEHAAGENTSLAYDDGWGCNGLDLIEPHGGMAARDEAPADLTIGERHLIAALREIGDEHTRRFHE